MVLESALLSRGRVAGVASGGNRAHMQCEKHCTCAMYCWHSMVIDGTDNECWLLAVAGQARGVRGACACRQQMLAAGSGQARGVGLCACGLLPRMHTCGELM